MHKLLTLQLRRKISKKSVRLYVGSVCFLIGSCSYLGCNIRKEPQKPMSEIWVMVTLIIESNVADSRQDYSACPIQKFFARPLLTSQEKPLPLKMTETVSILQWPTIAKHTCSLNDNNSSLICRSNLTLLPYIVKL